MMGDLSPQEVPNDDVTRYPVTRSLSLRADQQPGTRGDYVDERGVLITAAGRARMRRRLDELEARWTPEQRG